MLVGAVPKQDEVAGHVAQQRSKEFGDVFGLESVLEFDVEEEFPRGPDGTDQADFVPTPKIVGQLGRLAARRPGLGNKGRQA